MQIIYDEAVLNRLATRFHEIHQKQHLEKARALSTFLKRWSENARATGRENVCENLLPAAIQRLTAIYPRYAMEIQQILEIILTEDNIDWSVMTDTLYALVADYALSPRKSSASAVAF